MSECAKLKSRSEINAIYTYIQKPWLYFRSREFVFFFVSQRPNKLCVNIKWTYKIPNKTDFTQMRHRKRTDAHARLPQFNRDTSRELLLFRLLIECWCCVYSYTSIEITIFSEIKHIFMYKQKPANQIKCPTKITPKVEYMWVVIRLVSYFQFLHILL